MFADLRRRGVEFERFEDESRATTDDDRIIDAGAYRVAFFQRPRRQHLLDQRLTDSQQSTNRRDSLAATIELDTR